MGYYIIHKSDKQTPQPYYFVLYATNSEAIAISEMYATKQGAQNGINSVRANAATFDVRDNTGERGFGLGGLV